MIIFECIKCKHIKMDISSTTMHTTQMRISFFLEKYALSHILMTAHINNFLKFRYDGYTEKNHYFLKITNIKINT